MDFSPLVKSINTSFETTSRFWDEIGLTEDERSEQTRKLFESIHATLNSFVSQAEKTRDDMVKTIQQSVDESKSLCQLLSMNHHIPPLQGTLRQQTQLLQDDLSCLRHVYEKRKNEVQTLVDQYMQLCYLSGQQPDPSIENNTNISQVHQRYITQCIQELEHVVNERRTLLQDRMPNTIHLIRQLDFYSDVDDMVNKPEEFKARGERIERAQYVGEDIYKKFFFMHAFDLDEVDGWLRKLEKEAPEDLTQWYIDLHSIPVTEDFMLSFINKSDLLIKIMGERAEAVTELGSKIQEFWNMFQTPEDERRVWLTEHSTLTIQNLRAFQVELIRLNEIKRKELGRWINEAINILDNQWDQLYTPEEERETIINAINAVEDGDSRLERLRIRISHNAAKISTLQPMLEKIDRYFNHQSQKARLEEIESNPHRFKDHQLRIEGERLRTLTKKLPERAVELHNAIVAWERTNGPFTYKGEMARELIENDEDYKIGVARVGIRSRSTGGALPKREATVPATGRATSRSVGPR